MRAVVTETYGAPPVVRDLPDPEPGQGELLVRVAASSLNAFDQVVAAGMLKDRMEHRFPVILGRDFAGIVEAVGEGGQRFTPGDEVFGVVAKMVLADGGFAELVTVPEAMGVARVRPGLKLQRAGALGVAGLAALASVEAIEPAPGATVLISGATGGVGSFAIQLAVGRGLHVIATARPGAASEFVHDLGAADVVDYTADLAAQVRALRPQGVDAVVHLAGDGLALADLVVPGGRLASTVGLGPDQFAGRDLTATAVMGSPTEESLSRLSALVAEGRLRVPITRTYSLEDVPRAFAEFAGTLGKAAVKI
jgi:NADPH:quinone reductase-like Zn-dependent oxidoreductase